MKQDWSRLRHLFEESIDLDPDERRAFLDAECGGDAALRAAVQELVDADGEADGFLDAPLVERPVSPGPPAESHSGAQSEKVPGTIQSEKVPGTIGRSDSGRSDSARPGNAGPGTLGPYRVLRKLGQGGMGEVFLAERDDHFQRRVVIKVARRDLDNPDLLRRLRAERQILAGLDHPHIAHLYDGGTTEDQRPYFVMEYVEGVPIVEYCDTNRLSVDERITLFRKVCGAVQYAHQNLVVHRDLKPTNILVTPEGEPKLLDFGIAKILDPTAAPEYLHVTADWQRLLTPQYASPEQFSGRPVTTASDVYSLGVLLFELLTGRFPFSFARCSPGEIHRMLTEEEPPRPSSVVVADADPSAGTARGARPRELGRRLAGDLDSIVLKALRSSPHHRYPSVEGIAADLERFQRGLPVSARRGTAGYRLSRFLARHRMAAALTSLVAFLLVFVAATSYLQSRRLAKERDLALLERSRKAAVISLMLDVFTKADPYSGEGAKLTVSEALEASREPMARRLRHEPALRAELLHTTGVVRQGLGLWREAKADLEEAVRLRRSLPGDTRLEEAASQSALAQVMAELEEDDAAERARWAYEVVDTHPDASTSQRLAALNALVSTYCVLGDHESATPFSEQALELARTAQGKDRDPDALALALYNRASVHLKAEEHGRAADLYRQALALEETLRGEDHISLATTWNNLGSSLRRSGDDEAAEQAFRRALAIQEQHLGNDHPRLAAVLNNLAGVLERRGEHGKAIELLSRARSVFASQAGAAHPNVVMLERKIERVVAEARSSGGRDKP